MPENATDTSNRATNVTVKDRVIIITGAGRGLGKAYAEGLAAAGACIVVNDLGVDQQGSGSDASLAQQVVNEITLLGGRAVASSADITDPTQAQAIVALALSTFGRLDAVINNAGIIDNRPFTDYSLNDFEACWKVHVGGTINLAQAAWPIMAAQGYGRLVLTESGAGLYGLKGQATYAAAKGAVHGLMRTLALEGKDLGILVNAISPGGFSRMHEAAIDDPAMLAHTRQLMPAELVTPAALWLCSDACDVAGEVFAVWCGRVARVAIGASKGYHNPALTAADIAQHYAQIKQNQPLYEPCDSLDEVTTWLQGHWQ